MAWVFVYFHKNTLKGLRYVWGASYKALWRRSKRSSWVKSAITLAMTVTSAAPSASSGLRQPQKATQIHSAPRVQALVLQLSEVSKPLKWAPLGTILSECRALSCRVCALVSVTLVSACPVVSYLSCNRCPYSTSSRELYHPGLLIANINRPLENSCLMGIWNILTLAEAQTFTCFNKGESKITRRGELKYCQYALN